MIFWCVWWSVFIETSCMFSIFCCMYMYVDMFTRCSTRCLSIRCLSSTTHHPWHTWYSSTINHPSLFIWVSPVAFMICHPYIHDALSYTHFHHHHHHHHHHHLLCFFILHHDLHFKNFIYSPSNFANKKICSTISQRFWFFILRPTSRCGITLPKTNIAPENGPSQKETLVSQPSIFRCYVSFRAGILPSYVGIIKNHYKDPY